MALVVCPECGSMVSERAKTCPKCGFPIAEERIDFSNPKKAAKQIDQMLNHKNPWKFPLPSDNSPLSWLSK